MSAPDNNRAEETVDSPSTPTVAVVHYGELALKGKNRPAFISRLVRNIKTALAGCGVRRIRNLTGRIVLDLGPGFAAQSRAAPESSITTPAPKHTVTAIRASDIRAHVTTLASEMMDGRLKTLHPKVHGGILCRHDNPEDMEALAEHGILTFELVVVNLYPFAATIARAEGLEAHARAVEGRST